MTSRVNTMDISVLVGENEELYSLTVSTEEYEQIIKGDNKVLERLINEENERRSTTAVQQIINTNNKNLKNVQTTISLKSHVNKDDKDDDGETESFNWPDKAVMLFFELYRERQQEFTVGLKRHNKIWAEIASELQNSNYNVSAVQVQNKMSSLKRSYKKIKDSNAKSGNHNSSWAYYSVMDSLFNNKGWVNPPATASSDGPIAPSASSSSSTSSTSHSLSPMDSSELQDNLSFEPKTKKRKVEVVLESFISDLKSNRNEIKEERRKERLERDEQKEQRWKIYRQEKKEMHKETTEIQKSLVCLLGKLVEKQNESK
ncbi:glutamic acid-rich protein-like [Monomorium pharaonis]|uniref:glutamic acid-rich protein-like n=1 Tax=Monomorium pharaonis TaxID=307658 RepID=UPI0017463A25|nr:glutamic acid-rich protein-like [Monomorium pharaonis]XP_036143318.1 glutamic acid-rich protein-like [Monomorium pharaonis]XP_036144612.1 glutamic acid-rich protein-like [Monomorium pharaonis]XP_036144816.1 glutamic acid-rich protein-like [Monomorium pharaonis]XP_036145205.1 glutamic acid-rich protein-like [Monomorium pharaonis]